MKLSRVWNDACKMASKLQKEFKKSLDDGKKITVVVEYSDGEILEGVVKGIDPYSFGIMVDCGSEEEDCVDLIDAVFSRIYRKKGKIFLSVWRRM